jgi:tetratricopeptide (TPR) repeat protein
MARALLAACRNKVEQQVQKMFRVTSLTSMDDRQLNKWIKRVALLLVAGTIAFVGFYVFDRWRAPSTPIIDRQLASLELAVRDNPEDVTARGELADTYVLLGRYDDAIAQYDQILATGKGTELATYGRAAAYLGLEQYDQAAKDYQAVVDIAKEGEMARVDPILEGAYYQLGSIAMKQAKPAEAISFLEKALAINRSDADALYVIGTAYAATGATDKAVEALQSAVAFVPIGWSEPYTAMADAFTRAGKPDMAEWAGAMAELAAGKPELAEARLKALAASDAAVDAAVGLALLYETKGDNGAAADWYSKALASDPQNSAARLGLNRVRPGASALPALPVPGAPSGSSD